MKCRHCGAPLSLVFADLGVMPLSNAMLRYPDQHEVRYPLRVLVCETCWLVQTEDFARADEIFDNTYTYFSSYSQSWLTHARHYAGMISGRLGLNTQSQVIEIASNDGYLLQYLKAAGIPVLGIEPTANTAAVAREKGIETIVDFFGTSLAKRLATEGRLADLLIGNNVLAHVPDINDFVAGLAILLKPDGVITMEFPHLLKLAQQCQFDTIYHEHFSYLSLMVVHAIFAKSGMEVFDVEELPTHGGSLRVYARLTQSSTAQPGSNDNPPSSKRRGALGGAVTDLLEQELHAGITSATFYHSFQSGMNHVRDFFLQFLKEARYQGQTVAGYGAAAKGNTLLNYSGVRSGDIAFVADASPHKQGKFLPGSHIPVVHPDEIRDRKPNFVLILPWNIRDEIMSQLSHIREWGGKFVVAIPELEVM